MQKARFLSSPTIRIHVGAHKTATTYLQDTLALNRAASAAAGIAYWPREDFRMPMASAISADAERLNATPSLLKSLVRRHRADPADGLKRFFPEGYNVSISEENLLGRPKSAATGATYDKAAHNLEVLKRALPDGAVEILLCVRSYAAFISSLFAEAMRHGNHFELEEFKSKHLTSSGLWTRVVDSVRQAFPDAKIVVWRYEDFAKLEDDLLARMSGLAPDKLIKPEQSDILPSASSKAIRTFVQEGANLSRAQRQMRMLALQHQHPKTGAQAPFSLFDTTESARLCDEYAADIERIRASDRVELLA